MRGTRRRGRASVGIATLAIALLAGASTAARAAGRCGDPVQRPWCNVALSPDQRATLLLGALSQPERVSLLAGDEIFGGVVSGPTTHTGTSDGVQRVGLPTIYYSDGPLGPRQGPATAVPEPLGLAATFDVRQAVAAGAVVGSEARAKGNDVVFAPTVNIMRTPLGGRTYEAYGEDPYLVSRLTVGWIEGAQGQGVIATVKHFAANNQEGQDPTGLLASPGSPLGVGLVGTRYLENSIVDDRTLHEIYLPQFEAAVKQAHVGIVMCSYNQLNSYYACENRHLLHDILERDWGFQGYVLADYAAAHNTPASLNGGLDFEPWPGVAYSPLAVDAVVGAGLASNATVDEHVWRILRTLFAYGVFDRAAYVDSDAQIDRAGHAQTVLHMEESAITMLQNHGALPLDPRRVHSIAVIGKPATTFVTGGGSGSVTPFAFADSLHAIEQRAGPGVRVSYDDGSSAAKAAADARAADVAIVFAGDYYTEGADRACLTLECPNQGDQDGLIGAVAAAQPRTVVVLESGGPDLTPWRERVNALLEAWYPGEQGGPAIANVLFGDTDPGGRLPATFPGSASDLPTAGDAEQYPGVLDQVTYKEGVFVGYRWFDAHQITPAFPFGFGLSYTKFSYSKLTIASAPAGSGAAEEVGVTVTNSGSRAGWAVPQLYVGLHALPGVAEPPRQLRGFSKVWLAPGRSATLTMPLDDRAFSYWDSRTHAWRIARGCDAIAVGSSSRDLPLLGFVSQAGASCPASPTPGCRRSRTLRLAIHADNGPAVRVAVYVGRRRIKLVRSARITRVTIARPRSASFTLRVVVRTAGGVTVTSIHRYSGCSHTSVRTRARHPRRRRE